VSTVERARELRKGMTDAERLLWSRLRRRQVHGLRFRRQHPIGPFIADFACPQAGLVIELDGGQHALAKDKDAARTRWLEQSGYRVLRFWNNDVLTQIDAVLHVIAAATPRPPSQPPPALQAPRGEEPEHVPTPVSQLAL
jgi:very-short-patch-repair endonuclease